MDKKHTEFPVNQNGCHNCRYAKTVDVAGKKNRFCSNANVGDGTWKRLVMASMVCSRWEQRVSAHEIVCT